MQDSREICGSKWSKAVYFERILVGIARVWARLSQNHASSSANVTKLDHFDLTPVPGTVESGFIRCGTRPYRALPPRPFCGSLNIPACFPPLEHVRMFRLALAVPVLVGLRS